MCHSLKLEICMLPVCECGSYEALTDSLLQITREEGGGGGGSSLEKCIPDTGVSLLVP